MLKATLLFLIASSSAAQYGLLAADRTAVIHQDAIV